MAGGLRLAVRFGLHTGEAERRGADYFGPTLNLAARLRGQADGGQIFVSAATAALVARHLPAGCELVDLGPHRLRGLRAPERIHALKGPGISAPLPAGESPYRGLLAFEPDDRRFFFGREEVVEEILARLAPGRLLAVIGASGSGKSSVLRAGVVGAALAGEVEGLERARILTPGAEPRLEVADDPRELVVVDQFEELYTLCEDPGAPRRLHRPTARAVLSGRDRRARRPVREVERPRGVARAVADNQVLLGAMGDESSSARSPSPHGWPGLRLEPGLVELILRDVAREPGALPLLSHALRVTWEQRDGRTLTVEGYRASGGVASAIAQTADSVVEAVPPDRQGLMRNLFLRLTELGEGIEDTRRRVAVEELVPEGAAPEEVQALLDRLAEARLVTLGEGTAEVAHEVLIREWPTLRAGWRRTAPGSACTASSATRPACGRRGPGGRRSVSRHEARRGGGMGAVAPGRAECERARVPRRERRGVGARAPHAASGQPALARAARRRWSPARRRRDRGRARAAPGRPCARLRSDR